ncbi:MAG TPA: hypothetical protein VFU35_09055, partial [Jatrophihabitans sp.]|nr:hypothetical protein [Jatrophihabitans sp.]
IPIVTMVDDAASVAALCDRIVAAAASCPPVAGGARAGWPAWRSELPPVAAGPRAAFFADRERVPAAHAVGRVSAEVVAPYPPGIPVLVPGEIITAAALAALRDAAAAGVRIAYASDPSLRTWEVLKSEVTTR